MNKDKTHSKIHHSLGLNSIKKTNGNPNLETPTGTELCNDAAGSSIEPLTNGSCRKRSSTKMPKQTTPKNESFYLTHPEKNEEKLSNLYSTGFKLYCNAKNINGNGQMNEKRIQLSYGKVTNKYDKNIDGLIGNVNPTLQIAHCMSGDIHSPTGKGATQPESYDKQKSCAYSGYSSGYTFRPRGTSDVTQPPENNLRQATTTTNDYPDIPYQQLLQVQKNCKGTRSYLKSSICNFSRRNASGWCEINHQLKPFKAIPKKITLRKAISDVLSPTEVDDAMAAIFRKFPKLLEGIPPFQHVLSISIASALYIHFVRTVRSSTCQKREPQIKQISSKYLEPTVTEPSFSSFPLQLRSTDDFAKISDSQMQENKHFERCDCSEGI